MELFTSALPLFFTIMSDFNCLNAFNFWHSL